MVFREKSPAKIGKKKHKNFFLLLPRYSRTNLTIIKIKLQMCPSYALVLKYSAENLTYKLETVLQCKYIFNL